MTWNNGTDALLAKNRSVCNLVKFTTAITLMRWDNEHNYTCRTFFDKPRKGTLPMSHADNFPINNKQYAELWRVPALTVYCEYKSHHISADKVLLSSSKPTVLNALVTNIWVSFVNIVTIGIKDLHCFPWLTL